MTTFNKEAATHCPKCFRPLRQCGLCPVLFCPRCDTREEHMTRNLHVAQTVERARARGRIEREEIYDDPS